MAKKKTTRRAKAPTKKKTTAKKATSSRTVENTSTDLPVTKVAKRVKKARSKGDIVGVLSQSTGLSKKQIGAVLDKLTDLINLDVGNEGPGVFNVPGLMKIVRIYKPATKARKGINPFTKEPTTFKAKPARNIIKVRALKALKEMVNR